MGIPRLYKETSLFSNTTIARGIGTAQDAANTAQTTADEAKDAADVAQGTADNASSQALLARQEASLAAQTATNYITDITGGGIMVHPEGDSTSGWKIADAIELLKSGASYLKMWLDGTVAKIRVGLESAGHAVFSPDGMEVLKGSSSVAEFGESVRTGLEYGYHSEVSARSIAMKAASDSLFAVNTIRGVTNLHLVSSSRTGSMNGYDEGYVTSLYDFMDGACSIAADGQSVIVTETGEDTGCYLDVPLGQTGPEKRGVLDVMGNMFMTKTYKGIGYNTTSREFELMPHYTAAEVVALIKRFNDEGYYIAQDKVTVLTPSGADSGYRLEYQIFEDPSTVDESPRILDEHGNYIMDNYSYGPSYYYMGDFIDRQFYTNGRLYPQSQVIGAPVDLHIGGIDMRVAGGVAHRGDFPMIPAFIVSSLPSESEMPVLPCLVVNTDDESGIGFYLYQ